MAVADMSHSNASPGVNAKHLDTALGWARSGRPVFPCAPGAKRPMVEGGLCSATTDVGRIASFWSAHPDANVAVRTGAPSGLVVLDIDGDAGSESLFELEREHGELPITGSVKTPRHGQHFFFVHPGVPIKSTVGVVAPGIDVRGDGGYVLVPPSRTEHGVYEFDTEAPLAPMPAWLVELTRADVDRVAGTAVKDPDLWVAMLRDGLSEGARNWGLTRLTGYLLRRYVAVDLVAELVYLVNEHRCVPPLPRREVERMIDSVAGREARRRRERAR